MFKSKAIRQIFAISAILFGFIEISILSYIISGYQINLLWVYIGLLGIPFIIAGLGLVLFESQWKHMAISYFSIFLSFFAFLFWSRGYLLLQIYSLFILGLAIVLLWTIEE